MSPTWHVVPFVTDLVPKGRLGGSRDEGDVPHFTERRKFCSERKHPAQGYTDNPQQSRKAAQSQPAVAFQHGIPAGPIGFQRKSRPHARTSYHQQLLPLHLLYPFYGPSFLFRQKGILTISCVQTFACAVLSAWNASPPPAVFLDVIVFKAQHKPGLLHEADLPAHLSLPFLPSDSKAPVVWSPC